MHLSVQTFKSIEASKFNEKVSMLPAACSQQRQQLDAHEEELDRDPWTPRQGGHGVRPVQWLQRHFCHGRKDLQSRRRGQDPKFTKPKREEREGVVFNVILNLKININIDVAIIICESFRYHPPLRIPIQLVYVASAPPPRQAATSTSGSIAL